MPYNTEQISGRTFDINQPNASTTKAFIFLHGLGGNSTAVADLLGNPDPSNHYLVYPNGTPLQNDFNKLKWETQGNLASLVDIGYLANIIQHLSNLGVTEIGIGGHSNGAFMASLLVARYPQYFKCGLFVAGYLDQSVTLVNGNVTIRIIQSVNDLLLPAINNEYNLVENMRRFVDAGHVDISLQLLNRTHKLANINQDNLVVDEMQKLMEM